VLFQKCGDLAFDEAGVEVASNSSRHSACVDTEAPESINKRFGGVGLQTICPAMSSAVIDQGEGILKAPRASALIIPNVHSDHVKGSGGSVEYFSMSVASDGSEVANSTGSFPVLDDLDAGPCGFQEFPVCKLATSKIAL
jgi:hypothetical protein